MADANPEAPQTRVITFSREYSVSRPRNEGAYFIPVSEWGRLKRSISKINPPTNWFQAGGWLFAGIAITSFIGILTTDNQSSISKVILWAVVVCFGILSGALFYLDTQQRQEIARSVKSVVEEMRELEDAYAEKIDANDQQAKE